MNDQAVMVRWGGLRFGRVGRLWCGGARFDMKRCGGAVGAGCGTVRKGQDRSGGSGYFGPVGSAWRLRSGMERRGEV